MMAVVAYVSSSIISSISGGSSSSIAGGVSSIGSSGGVVRSNSSIRSTKVCSSRRSSRST